MRMRYTFFAALLVAGALIQPVATLEKRGGGINGSPSSIPMPDLRPQLYAPATAEVGQYVGAQLKMTIENIGDAPAPGASGTLNPSKGYGFELVFSKDSTAPVKIAVLSYTFKEDMLMLGSRFGGKDIAAKSSAVYAYPTPPAPFARIPPDTPPGNYFICIVVDAFKYVPESKESNNVMCKAITIKPVPLLPDIIIVQYQIVDAKQGKIKYLLKNQGTADAPSCILNTWLPTGPDSAENYPRQAPAIPKGQVVWMEVTIGYDVTGRKFGAMIDAYETVNESINNNNSIFGKF